MQSGVLGTVIIIAVMLVVFSLVFIWMYSMDMLFLPDFIEDLLGISDDGQAFEWNVDELQSAVKSGKDPEGKTVTFDITYENLKKAFLECETPEGEYVNAKVSYYIDGEQLTRKVFYYRYGNLFRAEMFSFLDDEKPQTVIIGDSSKVSRITLGSEGITSYPAADSIGFEDELGIPGVGRIIELVSGFPETMGPVFEGDITVGDLEVDENRTSLTGEMDEDRPLVDDCQMKLVKSDAGNVYYVSFTYTDLGIKEEYYLSLDRRMIIFMQSQKDGEVYYTYEANRISYDPEVFSDLSLYDPSKVN